MAQSAVKQSTRTKTTPAAHEDGAGDGGVCLYELAVLYPNPMGQKEEQQLLKEIDAVFQETGAQLVEKDAWGKRGLAYPIGGHTHGNFIIHYVRVLPAKVKELDVGIRLVKGVLRHLLIKPPKNYVIVHYGKLYEEWDKGRLLLKYRRERLREQKAEELQEKVAEKAKRQVRRQKEAAVVEKAKVTGEKLDAELDKLIASDTLDV